MLESRYSKGGLIDLWKKDKLDCRFAEKKEINND